MQSGERKFSHVEEMQLPATKNKGLKHRFFYGFYVIFVAKSSRFRFLKKPQPCGENAGFSHKDHKGLKHWFFYVFCVIFVAK